MSLHTFAKYLFDVIFAVVWVYVPMFYFGLRHSRYAVAIWFVVLITLAAILYGLHRKGAHSIYA